MLVDYTSASVVYDNVRTAIDAGVHVVVGSSGLTADDYAPLRRRHLLAIRHVAEVIWLRRGLDSLLFDAANEH